MALAVSVLARPRRTDEQSLELAAGRVREVGPEQSGWRTMRSKRWRTAGVRVMALKRALAWPLWTKSSRSPRGFASMVAMQGLSARIAGVLVEVDPEFLHRGGSLTCPCRAPPPRSAAANSAHLLAICREVAGDT